MGSDFVGDKLLHALLDNLSVEDLETIVTKKKAQICSDNKPEPMTEKERLMKNYRQQLYDMGRFFPKKTEQFNESYYNTYGFEK